MRTGRPSRTAMMVAFWRTLGDLGMTQIPNFHDPGARLLLTGRVWNVMLRRADAWARNPQRSSLQGLMKYVDGLLLRIAFIDVLVAETRAPQVVILGAGLDTRAWRLEALRGCRVFEVDHPATQSFKRERAALLGPPCADIRYVPVDFTRDDLERSLDQAGHDPRKGTLWIWEGVTMYLDDSALRATLAAVRRRSSSGSVLLAHYHEPERSAALGRVRKRLFSLLGEPQIGLRTRPVMEREIAAAGFELLEDAGIEEQAARVGATLSLDDKVRVSRIAVARVSN